MAGEWRSNNAPRRVQALPSKRNAKRKAQLRELGFSLFGRMWFSYGRRFPISVIGDRAEGFLLPILSVFHEPALTIPAGRNGAG